MQRKDDMLKLVKPKFEKHYRALLGDDYDSFIDYSLKFLRRAIRVNTLKISVDDLKKRLEPEWILTPVPWCKEGFWIEHAGPEKRRDVGNLLEHSLGYIYIQEPASMLPPIVLDPQPGETILDMCASPGSKSTQIAQYMNDEGVLICNDYKGLRVKALGLNLQRIGITSGLITLMEGRYFGKSGIKFDRILVDAPCSGVGTIRKSLKTLSIWNPNVVKRIAGTQRQLIQTAFDILKPGGTMVYSTCTLEPDEDEAVIDFLLENNSNAVVCDIDLPIKRGKPILEFGGKEFNPDVAKALRIWPQDNDTEGFFVCKIKKQKD